MSILLNDLNKQLALNEMMSAEEFFEVSLNLVTFNSPDEGQIIESILVENGLADKEPENEIEKEAEVACISRKEGEIAFNTLLSLQKFCFNNNFIFK